MKYYTLLHIQKIYQTCVQQLHEITMTIENEYNFWFITLVGVVLKISDYNRKYFKFIFSLLKNVIIELLEFLRDRT